MKERILEIVNKKHIESDGKCGTPFVEFIRTLNISGADFEAALSELYNNEEVDIRMGVNGHLVMKIERHDIHNVPKQNGKANDVVHPIPAILRE